MTEVVSQRAREASAKYVRYFDMDPAISVAIASGGDDGSEFVQAFARFEREVLEGAATTAAIHSQYPIDNDYDRGYQASARDAAKRIRALRDKA